VNWKTIRFYVAVNMHGRVLIVGNTTRSDAENQAEALAWIGGEYGEGEVYEFETEENFADGITEGRVYKMTVTDGYNV